MSAEKNDSYLDHTLTRVEDIQSALFELGHPDSRITVRNAADHEIAVEILALDPSSRCFYWRPRDYASADFANGDRQAILAGSLFHFQAQGYSGVQISFRVDRPQIVRADDGTAALISFFPDHLLRVQRRNTFRVHTSNARLVATGIWQPDDTDQPLKFLVRDLSVEGIGMRTENPVDVLPPHGTLMKRVALNFGRHGDMITDLEVRNLYPIGMQRDPGQAPAAPVAASAADTPLSHVGARFVALTARQQTWLQQVVWSLEKSRAATS